MYVPGVTAIENLALLFALAPVDVPFMVTEA